MTQESLHRIKRYIQMLDEKPIRHSHDIINGVHAGTEWEAELRFSDIRNVIHEIEKLRAALKQARRDALEEAAQYHDKLAAAQQQMSEVPVDEFLTAVWKSSAEKHRHYAAAIRALADNE